MVCSWWGRRSRGQVVVEAALVAPLLVVLLLVIVWWARVLLTWQQISTAVQYGANLIAYTPFDSEYIKSDIKDCLCNISTIGRILDPDRLDIKIEINDYEPINYDFLRVEDSRCGFENILNCLERLKPVVGKKSVVEIKYSYEAPKILKMLGKKIIMVRSRSEVLSGTGSRGALKRQKRKKGRNAEFQQN